MSFNTLSTNEYGSYYKHYIDKTTNSNIVSGLKENLETIVAFYTNIPDNKHSYSYAKGKWTVKDILLHCIDTERIFAYRALRIARQDKTPLPGYEQDDYVANVNTATRTLNDLLEEYKAVRQATITLFASFNENTLLQIGEASGLPASVRAIGYIITGHENHHKTIISERYI